MIKRSRSLVALLMASSLVVAACGGDDDDAADEPTEEPSTETTAPAEEPAETTEPMEPTETTEPTEEPTATTEAPDSTEAPTETTEPPVVRADADLVIWADDTRTPVIEPLAEAFGAENGITTAVQEVNFGDIRDRLATAGPAGEGPDVIIGAHDWLGQLVTSGLLAPVDLPNPEDFSEVAIEAMSYDGQLYGVPYAIENIALIRNVDLVPEPPATLEELEQVALDLVAAGEADIPLAIQNDPGDPFHDFPLYTAAGGYLFGKNDDGSLNPDDLGLDSEGGLAAGAQFQAWTESGLLQPSLSYDVMIESFGQGRAPFAITGPWAVSDPDRGFKATGVNYVVEPIPPFATTASPFVGVQGFMVSANAENPLFAQTFITEVMTTQDVQTALFEAGGRPPAHIAAFDAAAAGDPDIEGFGQSGLNGQPMPAIPEMGSVWSAWTDAYALILNGTSSGEEAFQSAADQIRALIAEG